MMQQLAPALLLAAVSLAVLAYWTKWRHDDRLRPIVHEAAQKMSDSVADEVVRGLTQKGMAKWGVLALLALGGGLLAPQGKALVESLRPMMADGDTTAATDTIVADGDEPLLTRPEWLDTRVIDGVPARERLETLSGGLRARVVAEIRALPVFDVGGGALFGDEVGIDYQPANGMMWQGIRVPFDWNRFEDGAYLDEVAALIGDAVREALP